MPAVLPEASVIRSPSYAQTAGGRSQAGAEQAASPFSELLDTCEGTEASAPDVAAKPAEATAIEAASLEPKAAPPEDAAKISNAAEAATAQPELMLAMVTGLQSAPEGKAIPPLSGADVAVSESAPDQAQSKTGAETTTLPAQADASDIADVLAVAQPVPAPVLPPTPATIDAVAAPATESVPTAAPGLVDAEAPAHVNPTVETTAPEIAQPVVGKNAATAGQAMEPAPLSAARVTQDEKPAAVKAETNTGVKASPTEQTSSPEHAAPASRPAVAEVVAAPAEKPAIRPAEAAANGAQRNAETPSVKPSEATATVSTGTASNLGTVSAPAAHSTPASAETAANPGALSAPPAHGTPASTETAANPGTLSAPPATLAPAPAETAATFAALSTPSAQASAAGPQAAHPAPSNDTVPVAGLAVEIAAQARGGKNRFEIRLDPPELGRIDVRLEVDKDGQVTSHLRVERPETLDLLRRDAPALERALQQAGLKTSDSGLQFSLRDQTFAHREQEHDMPAAARIMVADDMLVPAETQRNYGRLPGPGGGVDIRV